ncbi:MAG: flagellar biosynthesis anti-sigma factor FlgM [Steroidobacteraceae bacterium]
MADRIKGLDSSSLGASSSGSPIEQIRASTAVSTATSAPQPSVDSLNITDSARRLFALAQAVQDSPEIDTERVAARQHAIASGQYTINPDRVADRLLQMEQDLVAAH